MNSHDVIIVGAGPAGSTCAARLKKSGLNVKLFDKKVFPRVKPCAGWVTPQVIEALRIDVGDYRRENTFQPITGFRTGIIGGRMVETHFQQPVSYGIRRIEFDNYLLKSSGVPCEFKPVKNIVRDNGRWLVNETDEAPLIVGAGGHFCPVARLVRQQTDANGSTPGSDSKNPNSIVVYAQEVEFEISEAKASSQSVNPEVPELYFCGDLQGYGWCFRKGNFLNVGLGRLEKTGLSSHVREFWQFLRSKNKVVAPAPSHFLGHAYRLYAEKQPIIHQDRILLIGDSAGLSYPQSGEGIRPAVESALIAADVIANANGDFSANSLAAYPQRLVARLGPPKPYQASNWLPAAWLQNIAASLMATKWFAKNVVIDNWFLHRKQGTLQI